MNEPFTKFGISMMYVASDLLSAFMSILRDLTRRR